MNPDKNQHDDITPHTPGQIFHPDPTVSADSPANNTSDAASQTNPINEVVMPPTVAQTPAIPAQTLEPTLQQESSQTITSQPIEQEAKKTNRGKTFLVIAVLTLLGLGAVYYFFVMADDSVSNTVNPDANSLNIAESLTVSVPENWVLLEHELIKFPIKIPSDWTVGLTFDTDYNGVVSEGISLIGSSNSGSVGITKMENVDTLDKLSTELASQFALVAESEPKFTAKAETLEINGRQWLVRTTYYDGGDPAVIYYSYANSQLGFVTLSFADLPGFEEIIRQIAASLEI